MTGHGTSLQVKTGDDRSGNWTGLKRCFQVMLGKDLFCLVVGLYNQASRIILFGRTSIYMALPMKLKKNEFRPEFLIVDV